MFKNIDKRSIHIAGIFCLLLLAYHLIFRDYFPLPNGRMGHDYVLTLTGLLDGYIWFRNNGFIEPPWFTPSFCGGQAFFADPQAGFYYLPQFLTFVMDPLQAVYWAFLIFAALGFWGMYLFSRSCLNQGRTSALLASTVFMFNGFYASRMLIGHYGYQSFMLVPLIAYLLLKSEPTDKFATRNIHYSVLAGLLIAYWFHSGLTTLMIPAALAVISLGCLLQIRRKTNIAPRFLARGIAAGIIAICLCASKLNANMSLLANFSRDYYLLPGISDIGGLLSFAFQSLFYSSSHVYQTASPLWRNIQWAALPHELAYNLSPISLTIIIVGLGSHLLISQRHPEPRNKLVLSQKLGYALITIICTFPLLLLYYSPWWNEILKSLPLVGSTTAPFRWLIIFIPLISVLAGMACEPLEKHRKTIVLLALVGIPTFSMLEDRSYYKAEDFNPGEAIDFYNTIKLGGVEPRIQQIGTPTPDNDQISKGISPAYCYNPLYGYRQEKLVIAPLVPGPVTNITPSGTLNLHNPACLVFPKENNCKPWDAFSTSQSAELTSFSSYKPYNFAKSSRQHAADLITTCTIVILLIVGALTLARKFQNWITISTATWQDKMPTSFQTFIAIIIVGGIVFTLTSFIPPDGLTNESIEYITSNFASSIYAFHPEAKERTAYLLTLAIFPALSIFVVILTSRSKSAPQPLVQSEPDLFGTWGLIILALVVTTSASESPFGDKFGFIGYSITQAVINSHNLTALIGSWALLLSLTLLAYTRPSSSDKFNLQKIPTIHFAIDILALLLIIVVAAKITFIPYDKGALSWADDPGHMAPLFEPAVISYLTKATAGVDLFSQYGGLVEFAQPLLSITNGDPSALIWFAFISLTCSLVFLWLAARRVTSSSWMGLLVIGAILYWTGIKYMPFANFQVAHFRWFFPSLYLLLAACRDNKRNALALLPFFLGPLAIYWNPETGLSALFAWISWRCIAGFIPAWLSTQRRLEFRKLLANSLQAVLAFLLGGLLVASYLALKSGGKFLDFSLLFGAAKDFYLYGFFMLPMPGLHLWNVYAIIAAALLIFGIRYYVNRQPGEQAHETIAGFAIFSSLLFAFLFSYYQGRSFYGNLLTISYPLWLAMTAWFSEEINQNGNMAKITKAPLKILFIACVSFGSATIPFTAFYLAPLEIPSTERNQQDKKALDKWISETRGTRTPLFVSFSAWRLMLISHSAPLADTPRLSYLLRWKERAAFLENLKNPDFAIYYDLANDDYFKHEEMFEAEKFKEQIARQFHSDLKNGVTFSNSQGRLLLLNPAKR